MWKELQLEYVLISCPAFLTFVTLICNAYSGRMTKEEHIAWWKISSDGNWETAIYLINGK
jgi:hypothetical protein